MVRFARMMVWALPVLGLAPAVAAGEMARNGIVIVSGETPRNEVVLRIDGSGNRLVIDQFAPEAAQATNRVDVRIAGDRNGGVAPGDLGLPPLIADLGWGSLRQEGEGNAMEIGVAGSDNLFAVAQSGSANTVLATIAGSKNQAAVAQVGANNIAAFSQSGNGNMVSITQTSW